jgi:ABC-type glycerol-3-phosphate transport system substrate-binding protein
MPIRRTGLMRRTSKPGGIAAVALASTLALALVSTSTSVAQGARTTNAKSDVTINVAIAYPAPPKNLLNEFTAKTGIKVNYSNIQWDDLQTKIVAAAEAHTYFADVTDVDWSKVGEYYQTKWFVPLNKYFSPSSLYSQYPQLASFVRNGQLLGMPSDVSLLVTTVNSKDFSKAGVTKMPTTLGQYQADLSKVASSGVVAHPLDIPFAAAEGLSTYWYELTAAFGGQVLSSSYHPEFTSPTSAGYRAMEWMVSAYKSGLVPKGNLDLEDYQGFTEEQAKNQTASVFSDYSGDVGSIYDVPSSSSVVGDVTYIPTPGATGPAPNLANPDGIGIPAEAKNVSAAVTFIRWYEEPANQAAFAGANGPSEVISTFPLPSNVAGLNALVASGKVVGAAELATLAEHHSRAIFPAGAPPWYPAFSNAVYTNLHSAAAGQESVASAIKAIASQVSSLGG